MTFRELFNRLQPKARPPMTRVKPLVWEQAEYQRVMREFVDGL